MNTMPFQKTLKNQQVSWFYVTFGMTQLVFSTFFSETKMPELAELTQAYHSLCKIYLRRPNFAIKAT